MTCKEVRNDRFSCADMRLPRCDFSWLADMLAYVLRGIVRIKC